VKAPAQANLVEHKNNPGKNMKKEKAKPGFSRPKANAMKKKKKPEIVCYICGGLDHKANRCCDHKGKGLTLSSRRQPKPKCMWRLQRPMIPAKATPLVGMYLRPLWQIHQ
jgi:hypothetical protein